MPSYSGVWSLPAQMQAKAAGNWTAPPPNAWIATLGGSGTELAQGIAVDADENLYVNGRESSAGNYQWLTAKFDADGVLQWQRSFGSTSNEYGVEVALDSGNNVYVTGSLYSGAYIYIGLAKYNSDGVLQWQKQLGFNSTSAGYDIAVDSGDNIYVTAYGYANDGSGISDLGILVKFNSAGTVLWQRSIGNSVTQSYGLFIDGSDNIYVGSRTNNGLSYYTGIVTKYNTSGTLQWQRSIGGNNGNDILVSVAVDSVGDVYFCGSTTNSPSFIGSNCLWVTKYSAGGTFQWAKSIRGTGATQGNGVTVSSTDEVYAVGYDDNGILLVSFDTAGTVQYARSISGVGTGSPGTDITTGPTGDLYIAGQTTSPTGGGGGLDFFVARLPADGSLLGTYGIWTYSTATVTSETPTVTSATSSLPTRTASLTLSTPTYPSTASTYNTTVTPL